MIHRVRFIAAHGTSIIVLGSARLRRERVSEVHRGSDERSETIDSNRGFSLSLKEIPASLKILFSNPTFMSLSLAGACEGRQTFSLS